MPRTRTVSPRCHIRRQAQDEEGATMYSSPSPVLSSDDDDEEVFRATGARARPAYRSGKVSDEPRVQTNHGITKANFFVDRPIKS
ncbi:unnamed protein product [Phytophthora lilii]|uniref:Unnamed protein product n=1 Tax=Phytophthora lilii TaxID=2077276 RepID=A0A9W7CNT8_9STRA|nr:unnamed protein product [Phytophthora lilii]